MFSRIKKFFKEHDELRYLAFHDQLTGLLNRNWLYKNVTFLKHRCMYVYFIDLNDLYEVNKNGHIAGDNFIKSFTENISKTLSLEDFFIRYGGDEFILFTSARNKLSTCTMYAVGSCSVQGNIMESIEKADKNMLKNKKLFKSKSI